MATITKSGDNFLVKSPQSIKTFERELGEVFNAMVRAMGKQFQNQTINQLNKGTVEKFVDAQEGNYSRIFMGLANPAVRKLVKRFSDSRIRAVLDRLLGKVNKKNKEQFYGRMDDIVSINSKLLIQNDGTAQETNALILQTLEWAKRLRDATLQDFTTNTLRFMSLGRNIEEIGSEFDKIVSKRANNAKFLANNQVSNFNSILTQTRSLRLGLEDAIWRTSQDEKVRECHRVRDGKQFKLKDGLFSSCDNQFLLPGVDFNCRCHYDLIIPSEFS